MDKRKQLTKRLTKLRAAQALLQKAHDFIEVNGFDINSYEGSFVELELVGAKQPPCCYIGTLRKVAGLTPDPDVNCTAPSYTNVAHLGDGPELVEAFKTLDSVAKPNLDGAHIVDVEETWWASPKALYGRFVEALGLQTVDEGASSVFAQQEHALLTHRKALTKVYRKIEAAEEKLAALD